MIRQESILRVITLAFMGIATASAHHSVAAFDRDHEVALNGTVKQFIWANPHCWFYILVPDGKGGTDEWDMEGQSVNGLLRAGWTPDTLKPGMKVRMKIAPRRDGKIGGDFIELLEIDGVPFRAQRAGGGQ